MKRLLRLFSCGIGLFLCWTHIAMAQSYRIEGYVQDTSAQPLAGASVMVLNAQDSVLQGFSLTNDKGFYRVADLPLGSYLIQYTYFGYRPAWEKLEASGSD